MRNFNLVLFGASKIHSKIAYIYYDILWREDVTMHRIQTLYFLQQPSPAFINKWVFPCIFIYIRRRIL